MEIFGYDQEELEQVATVLRQEAEKLKSWRKKATYELIGRPDSPIEKNRIRIDEKRVYQAALLRDEHFNNTYYKISIRRGNLLILFLIIVLTVLVLPILAALGYLPVPICDWKSLLSVALFGVLGATFSVALTLTRRSIDAKIPEQVLGSFVTWMRPAIGAAAAMAAYVFLQAGFLNVGSTLKSAPAILAIAFIAGFSERLVVKAIDTASSK